MAPSDGGPPISGPRPGRRPPGPGRDHHRALRRLRGRPRGGAAPLRRASWPRAQPLADLAAGGALAARHRTYLSLNRTGLAGLGLRARRPPGGQRGAGRPGRMDRHQAHDPHRPRRPGTAAALELLGQVLEEARGAGLGALIEPVVWRDGAMARVHRHDRLAAVIAHDLGAPLLKVPVPDEPRRRAPGRGRGPGGGERGGAGALPGRAPRGAGHGTGARRGARRDGRRRPGWPWAGPSTRTPSRRRWPRRWPTVVPRPGDAGDPDRRLRHQRHQGGPVGRRRAGGPGPGRVWRPPTPQLGWAEQDAVRVVDVGRGGLRRGPGRSPGRVRGGRRARLLGRPPDLRAGDAGGEPLGRALLWSDRRAAAEASGSGATPAGATRRCAGATGVPLDAGSVAAKMAWLAGHEPARLAACAWLLCAAGPGGLAAHRRGGHRRHAWPRAPGSTTRRPRWSTSWPAPAAGQPAPGGRPRPRAAGSRPVPAAELGLDRGHPGGHRRRRPAVRGARVGGPAESGPW